MKKRFQILSILTITILVIIIYKLSIIQIIDQEKYKNYIYNNTHNFWYSPSTPRGKIYDRNGKILVDNEGIKKLYYIKSPKSTVKNEIKIAYTLSNILEIDYTPLSDYNYKKFYLLNKGYTNYQKKITEVTKEELNILNENDKKAAYIYYLMNLGYSYAPKTIKKKLPTMNILKF